jgi:hypothetical protein
VTAADDAWIVDALSAHPKLAGRVHELPVPRVSADEEADRLPYVVVMPGYSPDHTDRVASHAVSRRPSYIVHAAGESSRAASIVDDWIDEALRPGGRGTIPEVSGRLCGAIERDAHPPVIVDADVDPPYVFRPSEYSWSSDPA